MSGKPRHAETHFRSNASVRDLIIGMSDGLTVPFAIAASLSGALDAVNATSIVVAAGFAEIAAGSISMGLGGYLAARNDADHYSAERRREEREIQEMPAEEVDEVAEILQRYGMDDASARSVAEKLAQHPKEWVDFMMKYELDLAEPDRRRLVTSPLTIGGSYAIGGLVPLIPYLLVHTIHEALPISIGVTIVALGVFGAVKARFTDAPLLAGILQTVLLGGVAAISAYGLARLIL